MQRVLISDFRAQLLSKHRLGVSRGQKAPCPKVLDDNNNVRDSYHVDIYTIVDRPRGLEVLQHALLDLLGQTVDTDEVLQVVYACVVERAPGVHALDDGRHVTENQGMHQCCVRERIDKY